MSFGGPPDCLVLASSARLLAEALCRAGLRVDVGDCFGDLDCRSAAREWTRLPMATPTDPAPQAAATLALARAWADAHPLGRLVIGAGFEHRPDLLAHLAHLLPLAGSPPAVVACCKDPWQLALACRTLGLACPELRSEGPALDSDVADWLVRLPGGSGGVHIQHGSASARALPGRVWQRRMPGSAVSLLFLAATDGTHPLSIQRQFLAPAPAAPFRFGGVVRAHDLAPAAAALQAAASALARHFGLRGLNGLDGLWDGQRLWVLEVNPRPTASLALLAPEVQAQAVRAHLDSAADRPGASPGWLPAAVSDSDALNPGMAVVYASGQLSIPADFRFPPGCHDLPAVPHVFGTGEPVCTVQVCTGGIEELRGLIRTLRECLLPLAGADLLSSL